MLLLRGCARRSEAWIRTGKPPQRTMRGRAQPYGHHTRQPGPALTAMLKGAPFSLANPMAAVRRQAQTRRSARR